MRDPIQSQPGLTTPASGNGVRLGKLQGKTGEDSRLGGSPQYPSPGYPPMLWSAPGASSQSILTFFSHPRPRSLPGVDGHHGDEGIAVTLPPRLPSHPPTHLHQPPLSSGGISPSRFQPASQRLTEGLTGRARHERWARGAATPYTPRPRP
jgi:hypothetical protein